MQCTSNVIWYLPYSGRRMHGDRLYCWTKEIRFHLEIVQVRAQSTKKPTPFFHSSLTYQQRCTHIQAHTRTCAHTYKHTHVHVHTHT